MYEYNRMSFDFGSNWTHLVKTFLIVYGSIYVGELLLVHWFGVPAASWLMVYPVWHDSFHLWQIVTHPFVHDPSGPLGFLINCLVFFFFAGSLERAFGSKSFIRFFYFCAFGGLLLGQLFSGVSGFSVSFMGMTPSIIAMVVVFGLLYPEAVILLMFVIPVKGKYISYGTILVTFLTFLAKVNPHGAYHLGGILFGVVFLKGPKNLFDPNLFYLKYVSWRYERKKRSRFKVYNGYKDKDDGKPPTLH